MTDKQKIEINLHDGYKLVAEQNEDTDFSNEIIVGIVDPNGVWSQDLAIIRNSYVIDSDNKPKWENGKFDILVFGREYDEDFTEEFNVGLYLDEEESDESQEESYTAFLYGEPGEPAEDLSTYENKDEAIAFAKHRDWDEVVNDRTGEVVYKRLERNIYGED